jgi:hypothetical protein
MTPPVVAATGKRTLIVSACDRRFAGLLRGLLSTLEPVLADPAVDLACFDIGLGEEDLAWLSNYTSAVRQPGIHFGLNADDHSLPLRSFLARPFLREYFPGYDYYVWIDSDVWLQDPSVVARYLDGAARHGLAIAHEEERGYRFQPWLFSWTAKHFLLGYGVLTGGYLLARAHVNAGFFALAADAPHWEAWVRRYEAALRRTGKLVPHDQFALNHALHGRGKNRLSATLLDPGFNWICDRGTPMWNDRDAAFCKPYAPYERIGAMHLAGPAKRKQYRVRRTGGGEFTTFLVSGASPDHPVHVQPGTTLEAHIATATTL